MLERHLRVLATVREHEPIGILSISERTGYPNHKVRYSLRVLEEEDVIEPTEQGAVTTGRTTEFITTFNDRISQVTTLLRGMAQDGEPVEQ